MTMTTAAAMIDSVQTRNAAAGGQHIGDLTTWNATGVDMSRELAREIFESEGFGHLAPTIEPASALTRAGNEVPKASKILVRAFARPRKDSPIALGFYVQEARDGESGDGYTCGARVRITSMKGAIALPPEAADSIDTAIAQAEQAAKRANHIMQNAQTVDVSTALIAAVKELGAIPLRDRGGFYLVPVSACDKWRRFTAKFSAHGIEPITIEMHDAPSNVKAAASAVRGSLESEIAELTTDLEKAETEGMKTGSIERRVKMCEDLTAKAELYRNVLQDAASGIAARLASLRAGFMSEMNASESDLFTVQESSHV